MIKNFCIPYKRSASKRSQRVSTKSFTMNWSLNILPLDAARSSQKEINSNFYFVFCKSGHVKISQKIIKTLLKAQLIFNIVYIFVDSLPPPLNKSTHSCPVQALSFSCSSHWDTMFYSISSLAQFCARKF